MSALRLLLLPLAWLYGAVLALRHMLYDVRLLESTRPAVPTIVIGNLALGGTGKTPMLELVLRLLVDAGPLATLSRGYGRSGTNLREVGEGDGVKDVGDEPLQIKRKFNRVRVFVGAKRVPGIATIEARLPGLKAVVLDDAFQHRRLNGSLNILLTTYHRPWFADNLLPVGRLRDLSARRKAAQIVVVTKTPSLPDVPEQQNWRLRLGLRADQVLFFSGIVYDAPRPLTLDPTTTTNFDPLPDKYLLFTGLADPGPLVEHLRSTFGRVEHVAFPDHHPFSKADLESLASRYAKFAAGRKMLITTEKDAMRLVPVIKGSALEGIPIAVIAMKTVILNEPERFATLIRDHVATHPADR